MNFRKWLESYIIGKEKINAGDGRYANFKDIAVEVFENPNKQTILKLLQNISELRGIVGNDNNVYVCDARYNDHADMASQLRIRAIVEFYIDKESVRLSDSTGLNPKTQTNVLLNHSVFRSWDMQLKDASLFLGRQGFGQGTVSGYITKKDLITFTGDSNLNTNDDVFNPGQTVVIQAPGNQWYGEIYKDETGIFINDPNHGKLYLNKPLPGYSGSYKLYGIYRLFKVGEQVQSRRPNREGKTEIGTIVNCNPESGPYVMWDGTDRAIGDSFDNLLPFSNAEQPTWEKKLQKIYRPKPGERQPLPYESRLFPF
jgi:hypothetical protein